MTEAILTFNDRIKEIPFYINWEMYDEETHSITEHGIISYDGLEDKYKMLLYVYAWNLCDLCPCRVGVIKTFKWTKYKAIKLFRELKSEGLIESVATFSQSTGMLSGKGYLVDESVIIKNK